MAEETGTTDTTAATTTDGQANPNAANGTGAATGAATQAQADPKITAALKTLEEAGVLGKDVLTKAQHDGHMGAARRQWQKDADKAAEDAAADATRKAQEEQGQFKPLYETAQTTIKAHEATIAEKDALIASLSERVNAQITETIKNLPAIVKEFDPGADNLQARLEWFAKVQKHPDVLKGTGTGYVNGNGPTPRAADPNRQQEVTPVVSRRTF